MEDFQDIIISKDVNFNETVRKSQNQNSKISYFEFNGFKIWELFDLEVEKDVLTTPNYTNTETTFDSNLEQPSASVDTPVSDSDTDHHQIPSNTAYDGMKEEPAPLFHLPNIRRSERSTADQLPARFLQSHIALFI